MALPGVYAHDDHSRRRSSLLALCSLARELALTRGP